MDWTNDGCCSSVWLEHGNVRLFTYQHGERVEWFVHTFSDGRMTGIPVQGVASLRSDAQKAAEEAWDDIRKSRRTRRTS